MQTTFSIINEEVVNEMMYKAEIKNIYRYVLHELLTAPKIKRVFNSLQLFGALVYDYYNSYYTTQYLTKKYIAECSLIGQLKVCVDETFYEYYQLIIYLNKIKPLSRRAEIKNIYEGVLDELITNPKIKPIFNYDQLFFGSAGWYTIIQKTKLENGLTEYRPTGQIKVSIDDVFVAFHEHINDLNNTDPMNTKYSRVSDSNYGRL